MKKGTCEAVVKGIRPGPDIVPPPLKTEPPQSQTETLSLSDFKNITIEIDTRVCLRCPYYTGSSERPPFEPVVPGERIRPPIPSHPDIYDPKPPEKKPLRF
ncbi:MAG: hypothetical protein ACFFB3_21890 [Candidatus Hodarchaeota archaeon]